MYLVCTCLAFLAGIVAEFGVQHQQTEIGTAGAVILFVTMFLAFLQEDKK